MLPRAGSALESNQTLQQKLPKKDYWSFVFFCQKFVEILSTKYYYDLTWLEIFRFCFFSKKRPQKNFQELLPFIEFSRENWIIARYLDAELILGGRKVGLW